MGLCTTRPKATMRACTCCIEGAGRITCTMVSKKITGKCELLYSIPGHGSLYWVGSPQLKYFGRFKNGLFHGV